MADAPASTVSEPRLPPLFHVVMHEPEIPNNTGNIGRTCMVFGCALHLIRPLGFDTSVKALRRAGMDYWPRVNVREHDSWEAYRGATGAPESRIWLTSGKIGRPVWEADLRPGDHVVFGKETAGLPPALIESFPPAQVLRFPMVEGERGLNVATAVCAVLTEGVRQCAERGDVRVVEGRLMLGEAPGGA